MENITIKTVIATQMNKTANTANKIARLAEMEKIGNSNCDGKLGKLFEMALNTNAVAVKTQGQVDKYLTMINNGKKVKRTVEIKTNGGRIDNILDSKYVIYAMDICNSCTKGVRRTTPAIICKSTTFMEMLNKCNAIKTIAHKGVVDGLAIQVSSKKLFEMLLAYPIKYEMGKTYNENEILQSSRARHLQKCLAKVKGKQNEILYG